MTDDEGSGRRRDGRGGRVSTVGTGDTDSGV